jgi:hypothetical protein
MINRYKEEKKNSEVNQSMPLQLVVLNIQNPGRISEHVKNMK